MSRPQSDRVTLEYVATYHPMSSNIASEIREYTGFREGELQRSPSSAQQISCVPSDTPSHELIHKCSLLPM